MPKSFTLLQLAEAAWRTNLKLDRNKKRRRVIRICQAGCTGESRLVNAGVIARTDNRLRAGRALRLSLSAEKCLIPSRRRPSFYRGAARKADSLRRSRVTYFRPRKSLSAGGVALLAEAVRDGATLHPYKAGARAIDTGYAPRVCFSDLLAVYDEHQAGVRCQPVPTCGVNVRLPHGLYAGQETSTCSIAQTASEHLPRRASPESAAACFGCGPPCFVAG